MSVSIIPAVLEPMFADVADGLTLVHGFSREVQVDVVDGVFAPSLTWGAVPSEIEYMRLREHAHELSLELDLMVVLDERLDAWVGAIRASGAKRVVLHFGSSSRIAECASRLAQDGVSVGCAVHIQNNLDEVYALLDTQQFSFVQVMGIAHVGVQGSEFDTRAYEIIQALRERYSDMEIAVDGGVSKDNARELIHAGANRLCIGSAIMKTDDPAHAYADISSYVA